MMMIIITTIIHLIGTHVLIWAMMIFKERILANRTRERERETLNSCVRTVQCSEPPIIRIASMSSCLYRHAHIPKIVCWLSCGHCFLYFCFVPQPTAVHVVSLLRHSTYRLFVLFALCLAVAFVCFLSPSLSLNFVDSSCNSILTFFFIARFVVVVFLTFWINWFVRLNAYTIRTGHSVWITIIN